MKRFMNQFSWPVALLVLTAPGFGGQTAMARDSRPIESVPLLVERFPSVYDDDGLTDEGVQQLAREMGAGQFYVRVGNSREGPAGSVGRVFFIFASPEAMGRLTPMKRVFQPGRASTGKSLLVTANDNDLVTALYRARALGNASDVAGGAALAEILSMALYNGRASHSTTGVELFSRDPAGKRTWRGCFVLEHGTVEEVAVTLPTERDGIVEVTRKPLRPPDDLVAGAIDLTGTETWLVVNRTGWHPSQRFQLRIALAAMRHDPRQSYLLGAALWQENDDTAHVEGLKWLKAAAAGGYRDATNLLLAISQNSARATRNREIERKEQ
jgi:hypothetical protein